MDEQALKQWFHSVDEDRSGRIEATELQKALSLGGLHFSLATVNMMISLHDRDKTGTIHFEEFKSLHAFLQNMQNAFVYFDRDRSGALSQHEVNEALQNAGFRMDQPAFEKMYRTFDPDGSGSLSLTEFVGMSIFLQKCTQTFTAFDRTRAGSITLNFNQFVYACSNCR